MSEEEGARVCDAFLERQSPLRLVSWADLSAATGVPVDRCQRIVRDFDGVRYLLAVDNAEGAQVAEYQEDADALTRSLEASLKRLDELINTRRLA